MYFGLFCFSRRFADRVNAPFLPLCAHVDSKSIPLYGTPEDGNFPIFSLSLQTFLQTPSLSLSRSLCRPMNFRPLPFPSFRRSPLMMEERKREQIRKGRFPSFTRRSAQLSISPCLPFIFLNSCNLSHRRVTIHCVWNVWTDFNIR